MTSLLLLFPSILVPILSEWVKMDDLCFLDTALSSHDFRTMFLKYLTIGYFDESCCYGQDQRNWITIRGMKIKNVYFELNPEGVPSEYALSLLNRTKNFSSLHSYACVPLVNLIKSLSITTTSLTLTGNKFCCNDNILLEFSKRYRMWNTWTCPLVSLTNLTHSLRLLLVVLI